MPPKKIKMNKEETTKTPEEVYPSSPPAIPSLTVPQPEILVTLPMYSSAVKAALKNGPIKLGNLDLKPGITYRLKDSLDIQAAIKAGMLIKISGSFGPKGIRERKEPIHIKEKPKKEKPEIEEHDLL